MQSENRIPAVKQLMSNLLQISTAVQDEHGIKIYPFGEYDLIGGKESITSEQDLQAKLNQVPFATGLGVQGPLKEKILDPLAAKALHKEIHNPVLIIIVTDGGVSSLLVPIGVCGSLGMLIIPTLL